MRRGFVSDAQRRAVFASITAGKFSCGSENCFSRIDPIEKLHVKKNYAGGDFEFPFNPKRDYDGTMFVYVGEIAPISDMLDGADLAAMPELAILKSKIDNAKRMAASDKEYTKEVPLTERELGLLKSLNVVYSKKDPYADLLGYLESKGMSWEDYVAGKPVPGTIYDYDVPTPDEEYKESLRRGRPGAVVFLTHEGKQEKFKMDKDKGWVKEE